MEKNLSKKFVEFPSNFTKSTYSISLDHSYMKNFKFKSHYTNINDEKRVSIINSLEKENITMKEASLVYNVPYSSIARIYREYCLIQKVSSLKRGGCKKHKLAKPEIDFVKGLIVDDCRISLKDIRKKLQNTKGIDISITSLHRYVRGFHYSLKRIDLPAATEPSQQLETQRREYCELVLRAQSEQKTIVYCHATALQISMRRICGGKSSIDGPQSMGTVPRLRIRARSVLGALHAGGLLHYTSRNTATDAIDPVSMEIGYFQALLDAFEHHQLSDVIVVMDTASCGEWGAIKSAIEARRCQVAVLPPCSGFLNPVEQLFTHCQAAIASGNGTGHRRPQDETELIALIDELHSTVTIDQCQIHCRQVIDHAEAYLAGTFVANQ